MQFKWSASPETTQCYVVLKMTPALRRAKWNSECSLGYLTKVPVMMTKSVIYEQGPDGTPLSRPVSPSDFLLARVAELEGKIHAENPDEWALRQGEKASKEREERALANLDRWAEDKTKDAFSTCGDGPTGSKIWTSG
jgi:hypothetical protein